MAVRTVTRPALLRPEPRIFVSSRGAWGLPLCSALLTTFTTERRPFEAETATAPAEGFTLVYTVPPGQTVLSVDAPYESDWACVLSEQANWSGELLKYHVEDQNPAGSFDDSGIVDEVSFRNPSTCD